jgi:hypothetical protein
MEVGIEIVPEYLSLDDAILKIEREREEERKGKRELRVRASNE